jgi:DNA polymerase/3'-5' exonuclease PolX
MEWKLVKKIADRLIEQVTPFSERVEIVGSVRRMKSEPGDLELLCIPKRVAVGQLQLFDAPITGPMQELVEIVNSYEKVRGDIKTGKYCQRVLPEGLKLDFFTATKDNWGYLSCIRTGSSNFSTMVASRWKELGYKGQDGYLTKDGVIIPAHEEEELFELLKLKWVEPKFRF